MKYFEVETTSHSRKSYGIRTFYATNINEAIKKMKELRLPIFNIKEIKPPDIDNSKHIQLLNKLIADAEQTTDNPQ